jgi:carnitine-CoA ligase
LAAEELVAHCERRLPGFMVPRYIEIRDQLPRTPTGRIQKFELRSEPIGQQTFDAGDRRASAGTVGPAT